MVSPRPVMTMVSREENRLPPKGSPENSAARAFSISKRFLAVTVPEAQHFDDIIAALHEIENAMGAFENWKLLRLRVGGVAQKTSGTRGGGITQLADCFCREIVRVFLATFGFVMFDPVFGNFLEVSPGALRENYTESLRGHRC
jgi:hypothetical protein